MKHFDRFISKMTFIISTFFLFSTVFLFNSCEKPSQEHADAITQKDINVMVENHIIPLSEAVHMYKKYDKERVKILKDTLEKKYKDPKFNDTRMVWIDIKTMKAYLKYIEDESSKAGIDPEGLQFYFGVNSDKDTGKKKNHQTFFVAPTSKNVMNGDTIQSGYTLKDHKQFFLYEAFKKYNNSTNQNVQKASFFSLMQGDKGLLLNDTTGTPPGDNN